MCHTIGLKVHLQGITVVLPLFDDVIARKAHNVLFLLNEHITRTCKNAYLILGYTLLRQNDHSFTAKFDCLKNWEFPNQFFFLFCRKYALSYFETFLKK